MQHLMLTDDGVTRGQRIHQGDQFRTYTGVTRTTLNREGAVAIEKNQEACAERPEWSFRLYVAGQTPRSVAALANLKHICEIHLKGKSEIDVVDLLLTPALATSNRIVAVPSVVRQFPSPAKKIVGNLANMERVLARLDLRS